MRLSHDRLRNERMNLDSFNCTLVLCTPSALLRFADRVYEFRLSPGINIDYSLNFIIRSVLINGEYLCCLLDK